MKFRFASIAAAGSVLLAALSPAASGGTPVECYERYRTAPVYDTVYENVLVNPGYRHVETTPAIYGTQKRKVLVRGESYSYEHVPARVETRYRTVKVSDGGYSWEWRWIDGRKVLCKVRTKARYEQVAEQVVVRQAYKRRIVIPAEYAYQTEQVVIQPAQKRVIDVAPSYQTVARRVLVSEGSEGWKRVRIRNHCAS
ncbi:MAG: hypothetical protein KF914_14300 [Rhizobiaceae bacterium]|nr:hypothetical protein [Rhizobiaceae bacterium]